MTYCRVEIPQHIIPGLPKNHTMAKHSNLSVEDVQRLVSQEINNPTAQPITMDTLDIAYEYAYMFRQRHPGFDCMVVQRDKLKKVIDYIGDVFTGTILSRPYE